MHDSPARLRALLDEIARLRLDLKSANASRDNLYTQLNFAVVASKVVDAFMLDGMLTVVHDTGLVQQLQSRVIDSPRESGYAPEWVELTAVPGTAAAIRAGARRDAALASGMAVIAGEEGC